MGIIAFIILGTARRRIAKAILPGEDPGGFIITALIGIAGALIGGFLAGALFDADPLDEFFDISTWLTAIVGSIVLLLIYRAVAGRNRRPSTGIAARFEYQRSRPRGETPHGLERHLRLDGEGLAAAPETAHGGKPPVVLAPDVGLDEDRRSRRTRRRGARAPRRVAAGAAGRDRVRSRR